MSKRKTQIELALESLEQKKQELISKFNAEAGGLDTAIQALKASQRSARAAKPKVAAARPAAVNE